MASVLRTPSRKKKHLSRTIRNITRNTSMHFGCESKRELMVEILADEVEESRHQLLERETQLDIYAQTLLEKGNRLQRRRDKFRVKCDAFRRSFEEQETFLLQQLHNTCSYPRLTQQKSSGINARTTLDLPHKMIISKKTPSHRYQYSETYEIDTQIKHLKRKLATAITTEKSLRSKIEAHVKRLRKIRDAATAVNVRTHVMKDEFNIMIASKEKYVKILQYYLQAIGSNLSTMKRREILNTEKESGEMNRFTTTVKKVESLARREERKYLQTQRAASASKRAEKELAEIHSELNEIRNNLRILKENQASNEMAMTKAANQKKELSEALERIRAERKQVESEMRGIKVDLSRNKKQATTDEEDVKTFMAVADRIEKEQMQARELEKLAQETRKEPEDVTNCTEVTKERNHFKETTDEILHEISNDKTQLNTLTDAVAEIEAQLNLQREKQREMEANMEETTSIDSDLMPPSDARDSKTVAAEIKARADERQTNIDSLKETIEKLEAKHQELRQHITKRKIILKQKHQGIRENEEFLEEKLLGVSSLQEFQRLLHEEIEILRKSEPSTIRIDMRNWNSKIDALFEQLDSFYLS